MRKFFVVFFCAMCLLTPQPSRSQESSRFFIYPAKNTKASATEVFFSEYIEGSSNNKALELYNPTSSSIDLAAAGYTIEFYFNGNTSPGRTITLTGNISAGGTYVVANPGANATILGVADQVDTSSTWYNGDDAVVLKHGGVIVDAIGQVGTDPGSEWGSGNTSTRDNTIRRKDTICVGDANASDPFDPSVEWDGFVKDTLDGLGSHTAACGGPVNLPVVMDCNSPFSVSNGVGGIHTVSASDADGTVQSITITGITPVPSAGSITIGNFTAGDPATADVTVSWDVPAGNYDVDILATNSDATPQTGTCTLTVQVNGVPTGWIINEFQADPASDITGDANGDGVRSSSEDEFVEIVNMTGFDTDISGWTLSDGASVRHVFPDGTVIPNTCAIVVFGGGTPTGSFGGATVQTASTGALGLNNSGDTISLSDGATVQATVSYGSEGSHNQSLTRDPDLAAPSFSLHSTTAGSGGALYSPGTMIDGTSFCSPTLPLVVDCGGDMGLFSGDGGSRTVSATDADDRVVAFTLIVSPSPATGSISIQNETLSANPGDTATADVVVSADVPEGTYDVTVIATNDHLPVPGAGQCTLTVTVSTPKAIYELQGSGLASPYDGTFVRTLGNIVTAVGPSGFYMQDPTGDGDPDTSDGIYVYTGAAPTVSVGDMVNVDGWCSEYYELTEIGGNPSITVISSGNPLPAPVRLDGSDPSPNQPRTGLELERVEGMLVSIPSGTVCTGTDGYGDVMITAAGTRAMREPGILYPGQSSLPVWDGNPELFEMDPDGLGLPNIDIVGGTPFSATGVITYSFGDYQLHPSELNLNPVSYPVPVRNRQPGEFTVATQNMYRLFDDQDDGATGEPVLTAQEYADRLAKASLLIRTVLNSPDILGVQEVETLKVLQDLANRIHADDASVTYTAYLLEGNDIGGIDVGFLVRDTIQVSSVTQVEKDATFTYGGFSGYTLHDRPPLLLTGTYTQYGQSFPIQVLLIHNRSLRGIDGSNAEFVKTKRWEQADHIAQYIQGLQDSDPNLHLVVLGDFNAFEFNDGYVDMTGIIKGGLDPSGAEVPGVDHITPDLIDQTLSLPVTQRYSYVEGGNAQALDHILTSQALNGFVQGVAYARANADAPAGSYSDPSTPAGYSDHDGMVVFIRDTASMYRTVTFQAGTGGSLSGATVQQVFYGDDCTPVHAIPDTGYHFAGWTGDASTVNNPLTVSNVTADMTITATFSVDLFTITASAGEHGSVVPGGSVQVPYGGSQSFMFYPDEGYHVAEVRVDGDSVGAVDHVTFSSVITAHSVTVSFAENEAPVIDQFTASRISGNVVLPVTFNCLAHDPDGGTITGYHWEIGGRRIDTRESSLPTLSYLFVLPGTYSVTLTVTDDEGQSATSDPITILVDEEAPLALPLPTLSIQEKSETAFLNEIETRLINPCAETASVRLEARNADGTVQASTQVSVPSNGSLLLDPSMLESENDDSWWAVADRHLLVLARIIHSHGEMTAFLKTPLSSSLTIPHVAEDTQWWDTWVYLSNTSPRNLTLDLSGQTVHLQPDTSMYLNLEAHLEPPILEAEAWGRITSWANDPFSNTSTLSGFEMFIRKDSDGAACELNSQPGTTLRIPHIPEETEIFWTGIAIVNVEDQPAQTTWTFYADDGTIVGTETLSIPAHTKMKGLLPEMFPQIAGHARWGTIVSDRRLTGLEIYGTTKGGICGFALPSTTLTTGVLPDIRTNDGEWTGIAITNPMAGDAQVSIRLVSANGTVKASRTETIPAFHRFKAVVSDYFDGITLADGDTVRFMSSQPVIAIGVSGNEARTFMTALTAGQ